MMGRLLVGTSGYDYTEWKGTFYPETLHRDEYLSFYAGVFNALELNFTYYAQPSERQLAYMTQRTNKSVLFSVKGNRQFTHDIDQGTWKQAVKEFRQALYPVQNQGLLASVLLQFPQAFQYEPETRRYLASLLAEFGDTPLAVEFRHNSWQRESVYDGLRKRGAGFCMCDMPDLKSLPSFKPVVTSDIAYMRFHGRNADSWYGTDSRERYAYLYSDAELSAYRTILSDILKKTKVLQVYFNNHAKGAAAVNAQRMKVLLENGG